MTTEQCARTNAAAVRLVSPFPDEAAPQIFDWHKPVEHILADDFSPKTRVDFVERWFLAMRGQRTWAVIRDDEIGGAINSARLSPILADLHCIFKKSFWGHQTTVAALRLACREIFEESEEVQGYKVLRISTLAFRTNHALLGMVKAMGGVKEGVHEGHTIQHGRPVDLVSIGVPREGFYRSLADPLQGSNR